VGDAREVAEALLQEAQKAVVAQMVPSASASSSPPPATTFSPPPVSRPVQAAPAGGEVDERVPRMAPAAQE
jgi:hypothetical protein